VRDTWTEHQESKNKNSVGTPKTNIHRISFQRGSHMSAYRIVSIVGSGCVAGGLATLIALVACGGCGSAAKPAGPMYTISGTVIGLATGATVHVMNDTDIEPITANGSFMLPTALPNGSNFSVAVGTPSSDQSCAVQNGSGTVPAANVTDVLVYCTYNVSTAALNSTYTVAVADFGAATNENPNPFDGALASTYDGVSTVSITATLNIAGTIVPNVSQMATYTVATTDAIPLLNDGGGIEGVNADALGGASMISGTPPVFAYAVLPNANATTDTANGNYTQVAIVAQLGTGVIKGNEGPITLTNGSVTGTLSSNTAGSIVTGVATSGTFTISSGLVSVGAGAEQGGISADGDLIVVADTESGDNPSIAVLVLQGTGVTQPTFEGVYSVAEYGGASVGSTFGKAITLFAYGNGTYSITFTKNANGTITSGNTDTGTYTVADDGTLVLTDSEGNVYNGALSMDGNALVFGSVMSGESPEMSVGVRQ
jgi:hypothetical protein